MSCVQSLAMTRSKKQSALASSRSPKQPVTHLKKLRHKLRVWSSPPVHTYFQGTAAWQWAASIFQGRSWRRQGIAVGAAWRCKLVTSKHIIAKADTHFLVFAVCSWAIMIFGK